MFNFVSKRGYPDILSTGPAEAAQSWSGNIGIECRRRMYTRGVRGYAPPGKF